MQIALLVAAVLLGLATAVVVAHGVLSLVVALLARSRTRAAGPLAGAR
jgi:hypothetical protein